ncbi:hypothetical protein [Subtercola sp. RTI3]|uniref:hypothetical protein n=1 Tax=Subtercola sp. RTI3 TaxID=3048639 RepID=UPI002B224083|nr:hypothetical protein [Subtercola sp. RTI3]MEA9986101.1 hypothetical protein [Subtercola sp. RTI3]
MSVAGTPETVGPSGSASNDASIEFCDEWFALDPATAFNIGRDADLHIDDNQYLHRHFLQIDFSEGLWWLRNVGSRLSATVTDSSGTVQAWLAPGARLPLVFRLTTVVFTAGPTSYEFSVHTSAPPFIDSSPTPDGSGATTVGAIAFTASQRLLIVALAEPMLRRDGSGTSEIPSSAAAAERLGWVLSRFNRKLDNVCDKLNRAGVDGLRGGVGALATNRRARLVEYAVLSRLVTKADLALLDEAAPAAASPSAPPTGRP